MYATAAARSDGLLLLCGGRDESGVPLGDAYGLARHRDGRWEWATAPGALLKTCGLDLWPGNSQAPDYVAWEDGLIVQAGFWGLAEALSPGPSLNGHLSTASACASQAGA